MPPVRSVTCNATGPIVKDRSGTKTVLLSTMPATNNTVAKAEAWLLAQFSTVTDYKVAVHVFSIAPVVYVVGTFNLGMTIPATWWV